MSNQTTYKSQGIQALSGYGAIPIPGMSAGQLTINTKSKMNLPGITFKLTQANGGTIVTVSEEFSTKEQYVSIGQMPNEELYIIPDGVDDFDRELGKIITLHRMKQQHE
jgi:hypothetical protein